MKSWTDKSEYKDLKSELFHLERRFFERRIAQLLRICWPECRPVPELHALDQAGTDVYVWNGGASYTVAIQAKGFEVSEAEVGAGQANQVVRSIEKFAASGVRATSFIVVLNRDARNKEFREPVAAALEELRRKKAIECSLWDLNRALSEIFNAMQGRVGKAMQRSAARDAERIDAAQQRWFEPLAEVPLTSANLVFDRHALESEDHPTASISDPAALISATDRSQLVLLLGGAGYGKTTAVRRAMEHADRKVFFIPAARIDQRIVGTKDLLELCLDSEDLFEDCSPEERSEWRRIARPVLENLFKKADTNALLIFDALDEAPFLARERGAFQHFFNFFNAIRVPVVLTARTELWTGKRHDFQQQFGAVGAHKGGPRKRVRVIELVDWRDQEMIELSRRYLAGLSGAAADRVRGLITMFENGSYDRYYGDIPRRPLFLRMILDTVAATDVHRVGRAALFREWAELKIHRDATGSQMWGTEGRPSIAGEQAVSDTIQLAFGAMEAAAAAMIERNGDELVLLPSCDASAVWSADPRIDRERSAFRVALNTLLLETRAHASDPPRFAFAHRAFQEYFLARVIARHPGDWSAKRLPETTRQLADEISATS